MLAGASLAAFDWETYLAGPGVAAPKSVCMAYCEAGRPGKLYNARDAQAVFRRAMTTPGLHVTNHNMPFDLAIGCADQPDLMRAIWDKIEAGEVHCTQLREMQIANAKGELKFELDEELGEWRRASFKLNSLAWKRLKEFRKKGEDSRQLRYAELDGWEVADYPEEAARYPILDVENAIDIHLQQDAETAPEGIPHEADQVLAAWALQLAGAWGSRTDPRAVEAFAADVDRKLAEARGRALEFGLIRANAAQSRDMKAIRARVVAWHRERGLPVPATKTGLACTERDVLIAARWRSRGAGWEADPGLLAVADVVRWQKVSSTYVKILRHGTRYPVTPHYNAIIETYRTSCAKPNIQNLPRKGGMRDCFVPRDGRWYAFCDYDTLEMRTLAQACIDLLGRSTLAEALRAGLDPHVEMAAELLKIDGREALTRYEDGDPEVENVRQYAKIGNYGLGGGMGPDAFIDYARGYGIELTRDQAERVHSAFRRRWSEMPDYFDLCSRLADEGPDGGTVVFPRSGLVRGRVRYTAICNGFFQHPAAMGAKQALATVSRECYVDEGTDLFGSRVWYFGHDELGLEVWADVERASAAALRLRAVMEARMQPWIPDVPARASVALCRRWHKGAKAVWQGGNIIPCRPEKRGEKTVWVADLPN